MNKLLLFFFVFFLAILSVVFWWFSQVPTTTVPRPDFLAIPSILENPIVQSMAGYATLEKAFNDTISGRCQGALSGFASLRGELKTLGLEKIVTPYELWCNQLVALGISTDSFWGEVRLFVTKLYVIAWPLYILTFSALIYTVYFLVKGERRSLY